MYNSLKLTPAVEGHGLGVFLSLPAEVLISTKHSERELLKSFLSWLLSVVLVHTVSCPDTVTASQVSGKCS